MRFQGSGRANAAAAAAAAFVLVHRFSVLRFYRLLVVPVQFHSASARELRRIAMESLEALFGLQLPLPASTVRQYMQGIAGMMTRCGCLWCRCFDAAGCRPDSNRSVQDSGYKKCVHGDNAAR